jgi:luciferase family oxidoreductase group 1
MAGVRLSVLDTSPIVAGATPRQALLNTVDLAILADSLGFHRYWVPEHHGMRGVASSAPAVLVGHLANVTKRLRVGAGGVLLPNHAPIVVAEQFGTLAALHPGRIDLGLGRAPGGPKAAVDAVRSEAERTAKPFGQQLDELLAFFDPADDARVRAIPALGGNVPEMWLLGSSVGSAELAGARGLSYAFAHHLNPGGAAAATRAYRERTSAPLVVSVSVIAAEDDERAEWLAGSTRLKVLSRGPGEPHPAAEPGGRGRPPLHRQRPRRDRRQVRGCAGRRPGHRGEAHAGGARRHRRRRADGDHAALPPRGSPQVIRAGGRDRRPAPTALKQSSPAMSRTAFLIRRTYESSGRNVHS